MALKDEKYLWDRSGPEDPEIAALERLLAPLAHDERPLAFRPRPRPDVHPLLAMAAAVLMAITLTFTTGRTAATTLASNAPGHVPLRVVGGREQLAPGTWFTATQGRRELALGHLGEITLEEGTRLQVHRLAADEARLFLERGALEAKVSGAARPRFFQVATPASVCVDLGCRYTLRVDEHGDAVVRVMTGRVAFENGGREVYVPALATCKAYKDRGAGTPRFEDARQELVAALDAFDRSVRSGTETRRQLARMVLALLREPKDALPAWHLLQDDDPAIVVAAEQALEKLGGRPESLAEGSGRPGPLARQVWKRHLAKQWRKNRQPATGDRQPATGK
jgi:hypothetical protein